MQTRVIAQIFSEKTSSKQGKKRKPYSTFRKKDQKLYLIEQSEKSPTVSAENIARNTFQQTVRTDKNSRNDNNLSRLPKEDGSAK